MYQGINHPVNDPSLVSYHRPELVKILPQLEQAYDCWTLLNADGLGAAKSKYLPKEPAEPNSAYQARLGRSTYTPIYRDSIRSYAGLLSRFPDHRRTRLDGEERQQCGPARLQHAELPDSGRRDDPA